MSNSENEISNTLQICLRLYRQMEPIQDIMKLLDSGVNTSDVGTMPCTMSTTFQAKFMGEVINNELCQRLSPSQAYTYRLLKQYVNAVDKHRQAIDEDMLSSLMEIGTVVSSQGGGPKETYGSGTGDTDKWCWKTFECVGTVMGKEEKRLVSTRVVDTFNQVGLTAWNAGFFLAEFCLTNDNIFEGKSILELGAGIGLTGVCLSWVKPSKLVLTDYTEPIVKNLKVNIEENGVIVDGDRVRVEELDWENCSEDQLSSLISEVIVAADVVYDPSLVDYLVKCLNVLLRPSPSAHPVAYIASTLRNPSTFQHFCNQLEAAGLTFENISKTCKLGAYFNYNLYNQRDEVILLKIHKAVGSI